MSQLGVKPNTAGENPIDQISLNATSGYNRYGPRSQTRYQQNRQSEGGQNFLLKE